MVDRPAGAGRRVDVPALVAGVRDRNRAAVSRAITLVESSKREHRLAARDIAAIPLFPGVPAMLAALDGAGLRLGIASSNRESNIRQALGPAGSHVRHYACGASLFGKAKRLGRLIGAAGFAPTVGSGFVFTRANHAAMP